MRRVVVGLLLGGGCYSPTPPAGAPCPTGICPSGLVCSPATMTCEKDASDAGFTDATDAPLPVGDCYGTGLVTVCPNDPITGQDQITFASTMTLDTGTSVLCEPYRLPDGAEDTSLCVVTAKTIAITSGARLDVTGPKPLVLLATMSLQVDGTIDVASHRVGKAGAGAQPAECVLVPPMGTSGGPGGSFGSIGGDSGGTDLSPPLDAAAPTVPTMLRGGCNGATGGGPAGGAGGRGGGALALIADTIRIGGTINASGAGAAGGGLSSGGGGGGAGGMLVLDAPSITTSLLSRIVANGGGGGEGGGENNPGGPGADPSSFNQPATGGRGGAGGGGDGGNGAANTQPAQRGENDSDSGGGGGGGVGVIRVFPPQALAGVISPPPS